MAVKTSWSAGEVLTAADLTDTINARVSVTNGTVTTASVSSVVVRNIGLSTSSPAASVGSNGDVWLVYV